MNIVKKEMQWGEHQLVLETGRIARQSSGAVFLTMGETQVLATAVGKSDDVTRNFLPLTVNYQEKAYAAGKIPGGYFKREGRPSEAETLISRLIDRPIRPLFPKGYSDEVQVILTVLSADPQVPTDVPAMVAAAAALAISGLPFQGPLAGCRVGYVDDQYVLNPSKKIMDASALDLVMAGTKDAVLMVESEASELSEETMLGAVMHGHEAIQSVLDLINQFADAVGKAPLAWQPASHDETLHEAVKNLAIQDIEAAYTETDKQKRYEQLDAVATKVRAHFEQQDEQSFDADAINSILEDLKKQHVRQRILGGHKRIDGRDTETVRPITVESKVLHRTHGSALFTRGETQSLSVVALGNERDAQIIDGLDEAETRQRFMLHYNFPPYSVGEVGFMSSPKRREIGHGKLAWRAMKAVMPGQEDFPYVVRVVAETTESNGSSSMAAVCSSSMSLMDAGVPIKSAVAGVAMGLIKSDDQFAVLTDILGDEDHLGDMDFKVAGSRSGITALQMDIKITGITRDIMQQALQQAQVARFHILDIMQATLSEPRQQLSDYAPRIIHFSIHPDKIRDVIGKGGVTIRGITEETGASIDISDEGVITICAPDLAVAEQTQKRIEDIVADVEEGAVYTGKVMKIVDFGAFVNILPGKDGLVHVSQIANERVENVSDYLQEGQEVQVKVIEVDRTGRIRLSMKALSEGND